jgi:hypothetical protein
MSYTKFTVKGAVTLPIFPAQRPAWFPAGLVCLLGFYGVY